MAVAVLALPLLAALALDKKVYVYMLQEVLIVKLLTAISVAAIMLLSVAFVLFQDGMRRVVLWIKTGILQLAKLSRRQVGHPDPIIQPPLQR